MAHYVGFANPMILAMALFSEAEAVFDMMQTAAGLVEQFAPMMLALEEGTP